MQWQTTRDDSMSSRFVRGDIYVVSNVGHLEFQIAILASRLKVYLFNNHKLLRLLSYLVLIISP